MAPEQHASLWQRYSRFRRLDDREQLILLHQHLVNRFRPNRPNRTPSWYDEDDLRQAAAIGLAEAIDRYDPTANATFETFAARRIKGAALDDLRANVDWAPRRTRQQLNAITRAREQWDTRHPARPATPDDLAHLTGLAPATIRELLTLQARAIDTAEIDERVLQIPAPSAGDDIDVATLRECVRELDDPSKTVLVLHFFEDLAMDDVAAAMGIGRVTAYKYRARALEQVRGLLADRR